MIFIFLITSLKACKSNSKFDSDTVIVVNQDTVMVAEYSLFKNEGKISKHNFYFNEKEELENLKALSSKSNFFSRLDRALQRSLYYTIMNKLEWQLLKNHDIIEKTGYHDLVREMEVLNKQRTVDKKQGKVIYGPEQFSLNTFLSTKRSKSKLELRHRDIHKLIKDKEVLKFYEINKQQLFKQPKQVKLEWFVLPKEYEYMLNDFVDQSLTDDVLQTIQLAGLERKTYEFHPDFSKEDNTKYPKLSLLAQEIKENESQLIYLRNNQLVLVKPIFIKDSGYLPLNEVYHVVQNRLFDVWYKNQLQKLLKDTATNINTSFFNNE
jgi:hypothetical protein